MDNKADDRAHVGEHSMKSTYTCMAHTILRQHKTYHANTLQPRI